MCHHSQQESKKNLGRGRLPGRPPTHPHPAKPETGTAKGIHPRTGERKTLRGPLSEVQLDDPRAADGALPGAQIPNWRVFTFSLSLDFLET